MIKMKFYILLIATVYPMFQVSAAATHKHEKSSSKERLQDGAYSSRDAHHYKDGEHNVEFDHEAIIGNTKEAQEFDTLSPEESKKRLAELIKLMDLNGDHFIERHELKAWILRSFKKLAEEDASERFEEIDKNNDDKISWKEYILDVYGMEDENAERNLLSEELEDRDYDNENQMIQDDKEMWIAADSDQDGLLTLEEYTVFANPEENPDTLPIVYEHTLRDKDINGDRRIDFTEFIGDDSQDRHKQWLVTEKERFDKEFDQNKDGYLTDEEILKWVVPSNEEIANDEVNHLFIATDEDHNDRLSLIEILTNYETFVGSEATDYGDHLQNIHRLRDEL